MARPKRKLKCFLNYRRKDLVVKGSIMHIHDRLEKHFGKGHVFMDVDSIPIGADYRQILADEVGQADVVLSVMGNQWGEFIRERMDDPRDFVRIELEAALQGGIPVVPLLIGNAQVPAPEHLPETLRDLSFRNAFRVDPGKDFNRHMSRLIHELERHFSELAEAAAKKEAELAAREKADRVREQQATEKARKEAQIVVRKEAKAEKAAKRKKLPVKTIAAGITVAGLVTFGFVFSSDRRDNSAAATSVPTASVPNSGMKAEVEPDLTTGYTNFLGMEFVPVPGLDGVLFGKYETRVQDYAEYAKENPGIHMGWKDYEQCGIKQGLDHPVVNVSWEHADAFCDWLNIKEQGSGRKYRLPTDHEWSVAIGIGDQENPKASPETKDSEIKTFPWGSEWPPPSNSGNFDSDDIVGYSDSYPCTAPVGSFDLEHHGIKDLSGNVYEWVQDWYNSKQIGRVVRGECWDASSKNGLSSSYRGSLIPWFRNGGCGFRIVCEIAVEG